MPKGDGAVVPLHGGDAVLEAELVKGLEDAVRPTHCPPRAGLSRSTVGPVGAEHDDLEGVEGRVVRTGRRVGPGGGAVGVEAYAPAGTA